MQKKQVMRLVPTIAEMNEERKELLVQTPQSVEYSTVRGEAFYAGTMITYPTVRKYNYWISSSGLVLNLKTRRMVRPALMNQGYYSVTLTREDGTQYPFLIHRLVAFQFGNPPANFRKMQVNHIDGNHANNAIWNLEWISSVCNNHHAMEFLANVNHLVEHGRPIVNEKFVRFLCKEFEAGKSNTQILKENGMKIDNANHTLLRDIRGGYTWKEITSQYNFDRSSKKHAYSKEQKEDIKYAIMQGYTDVEIFKIMQNRDYIPSIDRLDSKYRTIQSLRTALRKKGELV
jgi:hypothetical protein